MQYTNEGINSFIPEGERKVTKYTLLSSKASYLEKMQENEKALNVVLQLWTEQDQWYRNIDVTLNMMEIRANLAANGRFFEEAMDYG